MTLNITAVSPNRVVQLSDRRMVRIPERMPLSDETNKALVLSCSDAVLSITYTGIAALGEEPTDAWLAHDLLNAGVAELPAEEVVSHLAAAATQWFRSFRVPNVRHVFVVAGFERGSRGPRSWIISNSPAGDLTRPGRHPFHASTGTYASRLLVTGLTPAFTRTARRRLQAVGRHASDPGELEPAMVSAVRAAASDPKWSWGIGKDCMSVLLMPTGQVQATSYPFQETPRGYGPNFLYFASGYNILIESPRSLLGSGYGIVFGEEPATLMLLTQGPQIKLPSGQGKVEFEPVKSGQSSRSLATGQVNFRKHSVPARYHEIPDDREVDLVKVVRL